MIRIEMHFLADVFVECELCRGRRFNRETLEISYKGKNIADVLELTIDEAAGFFRAVPQIHGKLEVLQEVGLGYLKLGQSATTLSGGEAQRLKLASELSRKATGRTLYLLDEPTTGLHFADIQKLLEVLLRLRDGGNTLIVIEHDLEVIKCADWIIDMGPGRGRRGGIPRRLRHAGRGGGACLKPYGLLAAACLATLSSLTVSVTLRAQETNPAATNSPQPVDLARHAASEHLPQVSAALLRTQIQQEQDPAKRELLARRLVALLVQGGRNEEALAVCASSGGSADPVMDYWKARALAATGDHAAARPILQGLLDSGTPVPGVNREMLLLAAARSLRGSGDPAAAASLLEGISSDSPLAEDAVLEKGADLLAAGKTDECIALMHSALADRKGVQGRGRLSRGPGHWRAGNPAEAARLFTNVPPVTPWIASASAIGAAECLLSSSKSAKAFALLEKHLDGIDDAPLIAEEFRLYDRIVDTAKSGSKILPYAKWAQNKNRPVRAKYAAFFDARRRHLDDPRGGASQLKAFVAAWPDDPLSDEGRLLLALAALRQGNPGEAAKFAEDRPSAAPGAPCEDGLRPGACRRRFGQPGAGNDGVLRRGRA